MGLRIALGVDATDAHARSLMRAFAAHGAQAVPVRLPECRFDTAAPYGLHIPGFPEAPPDAVMVREITGGSFEAVTRRLGILHALAALGVPGWNDARAIERCVDKSTTSFLLAHAGLPTPDTWAVETIAEARAIMAREAGAGPLVLKPLFGSQGRGLRLIDTADELPDPAEVAGVYYLQRFIPTGDGTAQDHRLLVCDGQVVAAMTRRAQGWITNVKRGGTPEPFDPPAALCALAIEAASCVGAAYAGVDLLLDPDQRPLVLEVNSMPAWRGLQLVTPVRIADRLASLLLARLR